MFNTKQKICATSYRLLIAFVVIYCFTTCFSEGTPVLVSCAILRMMFVYTSLRFLFLLIPQFSRFAILFLFALICVKEAYIGVSQLFGFSKSNHYLYAITGSFQNPGPYGGFLAVCTSLLTAFYLKAKDYPFNSITRKLTQWISLIITIVALIILPSTQSRSAILSLGCSMILLIIGTDSIRVKIITVLNKSGLWIALALVVICIGAYLYKKPSADGRFFMDKICIKAMCENGWKGAGIGHFGGAYGDAQACFFKKQIDKNGKEDLDWRAIDEHDRMTADCPNNAFNEYLFIGVEAGPIAMLLFIGIIISAIVISFKRDTIWCYGLTAFAVFAMFSYPLHVKQFQLIFPIILAACSTDGGHKIQDYSPEMKVSFYKRTQKQIEYVTIIVMLVVLTSIIILNLPNTRIHKQAEITWKEVERWHTMEYYEYVVEDCDTLLPYLNHDYRFLFAYGQSLNKIGNYEKSDSILKIGTEFSSDPMFWNVMGNNSLALGKYREAEERYKHAFYIAPNRLYPLYLLSMLYYEEGDTTKFLNIADKIVSFTAKVESRNTEQLRNKIKEIRIDYLIERTPMYIGTDIHSSAPR